MTKCHPEGPFPAGAEARIETKGMVLGNVVDTYMTLQSVSLERKLDDTELYQLVTSRKLLIGWNTGRLEREYDNVYSFSDDARHAVRKKHWKALDNLERMHSQHIPEVPEEWNFQDIYAKLGLDGLHQAFVVCFCDRLLQPKVKAFLDALLA